MKKETNRKGVEPKKDIYSQDTPWVMEYKQTDMDAPTLAARQFDPMPSKYRAKMYDKVNETDY